MKKQNFYTIFILMISVFALLATGCSDDENNEIFSGNDISSFIVSIYPPVGATDVSPSSSMWIKFSEPMDTISVMNNFYYSGGANMHEWMDSTNLYGGMGHMNMGMNNHMMNWIDSIQIPGTYSWNNAFDSCEFIPDSIMLTNTEYMMFMYEDGIMNHRGEMMNLNHDDNGYHTYQFITGEGN